MDFIHRTDILSNEKIIYASFVCDHLPLIPEKWRTRLVVGGDILPCCEDMGVPAANLLECKLLFNCVISDVSKGAHFMTLNLKDHYAASPMPTPAYIKIPSRIILPDIYHKYNLQTKIQNKYVYCKIKKRIYGLKQAAPLAYNFLLKNLAPFGYKPIPHTTGLWKHYNKPITFCLCIDDIGVKYFHKNDVNHLTQTLKEFYKVSMDWTGEYYCASQTNSIWQFIFYLAFIAFYFAFIYNFFILLLFHSTSLRICFMFVNN